jgi:hypothetical protein
MSISNKKRDRDKDSKGSASREAGNNYIAGIADRGGKTSITRKEEGEVTAATSTAPSRATSNQERITPQKEKTASTLETRRDEMPAVIVTTPTTTMKTITEVPDRYQQKEQQQQSLNRVFDETRDSIRKSIEEARSQIPHYTQAANEYQEQTIQRTREIADNFLESQKEIINSFQSVWQPQIDAINRIFTSNWMSPGYFTQMYTNMISNLADNIVTATRLLNNMVFANMQAFKATMKQAKDNAKEFSRISVNAARSLEEIPKNAAAVTDRGTNTTNTYSSTTSSALYSDRGYYFNEEKQEQIPSRQNEEDIQIATEEQNRNGGQRREQTVTDLPRATSVGQALKDLRFPVDKNRILQFVQEQSNTNPGSQEMMPLLDKIEDRQYQNVSDITNAAGLAE